MKTGTVEVAVLVVTHGQLAAELVAAATTILGGVELPQLGSLSIGWDQDVDEARQAIADEVERTDRGVGVLVLTDMFGGTPTNLSLTFLDDERVEIVTGVNLPMVVKSAGLRLKKGADGAELRRVADEVASKGAESVIVASAMLEPRSKSDDESEA
ncbi:MAG: PTS fructose transporter subunit IIA [Acidobacteriota bacterium]